jgi:beta-lactamase class A
MRIASPEIATPAPRLPSELAEAVGEQERRFSGRLALWVHDLRRGETYGLRAEEPFRPASTIKLFVLLEVLRQCERGALRLDERIVLGPEDMVTGSGVLKDLSPGLSLSIRDVASLMIILSDNVAANLLIGRLGTAAINRSARDLGFHSTRLSGKFFRHPRLLSTSTAGDLGRLMMGIARRTVLSPAASGTMLDILRREQDHHIVGRFLPQDQPSTSPRGPAWLVAVPREVVLAHRLEDVGDQGALGAGARGMLDAARRARDGRPT